MVLYLMIKRIFLILSVFLLYSCEDNIMINDYNFIDVYLEDYIDENNYYHIEWRGYTYHSVHFQTLPNKRVFWGSPNDFYMWSQGYIFEEPIIDYSTYADEWGNGQQFFWIDSNMIGDTLSIVGCVAPTMDCDYINVILEDNQ